MALPCKPSIQLTVFLSDSIRCTEPWVSIAVDEASNAQDVVRAAAAKARLVNPHGFELAEVFVSHGQPRKERRLEPTQLPHRIQSLWPQAPVVSRTGRLSQSPSLPGELEAEYRFYLVRREASTTVSLTSSLHDSVATGHGGGAAFGTVFTPSPLRTAVWTECPAVGAPLDPYLAAFLNQRWDGAECADLCRLPTLDELSLLNNLRRRFANQNAYTYVGSILVAVNPFQFFPIYNPKYVRMYEGRRLGELPPHIFAIADATFHAMIEGRSSQCVVISGESGSGKTESTNFLLHHLTHLSHKGSQSVHGVGVEHTLLGAGPVLEAFGNAKTVHNNNSSRFGKYIQVNYRKNGTVHGAVVEKYLLEKSRIVSQPKEERNYHVFYYLLSGAPAEIKQSLALGCAADYNYLNQSGCYDVKGVDDKDEYARLRQSMELVGFSVDLQKKILSVLAAVLHLGNIEFQKKHDYHHDDAVLIGNTGELKLISDLLCVKEDTLLEALTSRRTVAGGDTVVVNYKKADALATRDAMAKCLYGALFDWIVLQINHSLLLKQDSRELLGNSIGVLDIFGFEDFKVNGFEQFCINYANEHLQYYFNQHIFKFEQEEYEKEGIVWQNIEFIDNTGCIDLFAKRPKGLFFLLDEEGNFPGATNDTLLEKFNQNHRSSHYYQMPTKKESAFIVCHYAGKVKYFVQDFREKNNDHMRPDIVSVLKNSSLSFVKELVGARIGIRRRQSVQKVGPKTGQSSVEPCMSLPPCLDTPDGACAYSDSANEAAVFRDESDSATTDSYIYKGSVSKARRKSSKGKHRSKVRAFKGYKELQTLQDVHETTKSKTPTISLQFQHSLGLLLNTLDKANPFFVRCIKSNEQQAPEFFDEDVVLRQLRYTGMLATVKIRQSGYNYRSHVEDFVRQYRALLPRSECSDKAAVNKFLSDIDCKGNFQIGASKVFLRETLKILLDQALNHALTARIVKIQRWVRSRLERVRYVRMQTAVLTIQRCWRRRVRARHGAVDAVKFAVEKDDEVEEKAYGDEVNDRPVDGVPALYESRHSRPVQSDDGLPTLIGYTHLPKLTLSTGLGVARLIRDDSLFERDFEIRLDRDCEHLERTDSVSSSSEGECLSTVLPNGGASAACKELRRRSSSLPTSTTGAMDIAASTVDTIPCPSEDVTSPGEVAPTMVIVTFPADAALGRNDIDVPPVEASLGNDAGQKMAALSPSKLRRDSEASSASSGSTSSISSCPDSEKGGAALGHISGHAAPHRCGGIGPMPGSPHVPSREGHGIEHGKEQLHNLGFQRCTLDSPEFDRHSIYRKGIKKSQSADSIPPQHQVHLPGAFVPAVAPVECPLQKIPMATAMMHRQVHIHQSDEDIHFISAAAAVDSSMGRKRSLEAKSSLPLKTASDDDAASLRPRLPSSGSIGKPSTHILTKIKSKLSGPSKPPKNAGEENEMDDLKPAPAKTPDNVRREAWPELAPMATPLNRRRSKRTAPKETVPVAVTQWTVASTSQWQYPENWEVGSHSTLSKMNDFIFHKKQEFNKGFGKQQEVPVFDRVFKDSLCEFQKMLITRLATGNEDMWTTIKYRDLMENFSQMLCRSIVKENVGNRLDFPSTLAINAFRGYLDEFHKQTENDEKREKKTKKKKEKTKNNQEVIVCGHHLYPMTFNIRTFCEVCNKMITFLYEKGLECEACKFSCHKACTSKCTTVCGANQNEPTTSSGFVFGKHLSELVLDDDHPVPAVFEKLIQAVETKGLYTEGIYRKSGLAERVRTLKKTIDTTADVDDIDLHDYAVHVLTSAVKAFLRDLAEPLLTHALYNEFVRAADVEDSAEALQTLKATLEKLPHANHSVLLRLMMHLARVAQNEATNRMSANALAIVFSPCLLKQTVALAGPSPGSTKRATVATTAVQESLRDVPRQVRCVELLLDWMLRRLDAAFTDLDKLESAEQLVSERLTKVRASMRTAGRKRRSMHLPLHAADGSQPPVPQTNQSPSVDHSQLSPVTPSEDMDPEVAAAMEQKLTEQIKELQLKRNRVTGRLAKIDATTDEDQLSTDDIDTSGDSIDGLSLDAEGERQRNGGGSGSAALPTVSTVVATPLSGLPAPAEVAHPLSRQKVLQKRNIFKF